MSDTKAKLEPFLLLAPGTKGASAAKVIMDATAAPGVYTFGELLALPNIQQLASDPSTEKQFALLELFAYGDLTTYNSSPSSFPPLTPAHLAKLKQLTLVSLALQHRSALTGSSAGDALSASSVRELEDLIIDTIYAGLLRGKMHHHEQILHVDWVTGRDLRKEDLEKVKQGLENWCQTARTLLQALDDQIASAHQQAQDESDASRVYSDHRNALFAQALDSASNPAPMSAKVKGGFGNFRGEAPMPVCVLSTPILCSHELIARGKFEDSVTARGQKRQRD